MKCKLFFPCLSYNLFFFKAINFQIICFPSFKTIETFFDFPIPRFSHLSSDKIWVMFFCIL
ncbi:hypothetical protein BDF20DRAFT_898854, partial [Mycotypha africana]|uniref:uncharacterized protein n=1 Tax=Mycotypha africana TaxID=64632 RepID=UPI0023000145